MRNLWQKVKSAVGIEEADDNNNGFIEELNVGKNRNNVVPFPASKQSEIIIHEPRVYEDSLSAAAHLREGKPVIINLKYLDADQAKRFIDFVCGTAYAIDGHMLKIGESIFLFTPVYVMISDAEEKSTLERGLEQAEKESFFRRR